MTVVCLIKLVRGFLWESGFVTVKQETKKEKEETETKKKKQK